MGCNHQSGLMWGLLHHWKGQDLVGCQPSCRSAKWAAAAGHFMGAPPKLVFLH